MKKERSHKLLIVAVVLILSLSITAGIVAWSAKNQRDRNIEHAGYILESEANKIQYSIDSRLMKLEILEMMVLDHNGGTASFENIAGRLYEGDPSLRSLQLAPGGNVTHVYPVEGNEEAYGDIFSDPDRWEEAEYARNTGNMTLAGPFELYQGGLGVVVRRPIYLEAEDGGKKFWGFAIAVMDVPEIFDKADLGELSREGYLYQITRLTEDGENQIIVENGKAMPSDAVESDIQVPGSVWTLSIVPEKGWLPWRDVFVMGGLGLVINLLIALTAYYFITAEGQKKTLKHLANTDPLTGLYNERFLGNALKKLGAEREPFGLLFLDLNKFKDINDTHGHDIGDKVLTSTAQRIQGCLSGDDMVFRVGGDEFSAIIIGEHSAAFYQTLLRQIQKAIEQPLDIDGMTLCFGISCGWARYPEDCQDIERLLKAADQKMYEQKHRL